MFACDETVSTNMYLFHPTAWHYNSIWYFNEIETQKLILFQMFTDIASEICWETFYFIVIENQKQCWQNLTFAWKIKFGSPPYITPIPTRFSPFIKCKYSLSIITLAGIENWTQVACAGGQLNWYTSSTLSAQNLFLLKICVS